MIKERLLEINEKYGICENDIESILLSILQEDYYCEKDGDWISPSEVALVAQEGDEYIIRVDDKFYSQGATYQSWVGLELDKITLTEVELKTVTVQKWLPK